MRDIIVDFLQSGEEQEAAKVLGCAFVTNPNSVAIWRARGENEILKQSAIFRLLKLERPKSTVIVARIDSRIVGALNMIEWPQCQMSTRQTLKLLPKMLLIMKSAMLSGVMSRAKKLQSSWQEHDPQEPHWHLGPIGVLPEMQRKGIGSKMLKRACEIIDQKLDAAYLETDRSENLPLYERFGFSTIAEDNILGAHNWFMWRSTRETVAPEF